MIVEVRAQSEGATLIVPAVIPSPAPPALSIRRMALLVLLRMFPGGERALDEYDAVWRSLCYPTPRTEL